MAKTPLTHAGDKVSQVGRPRSFDTPEDLMEACEEYLEWNEANPILAPQPFHFQGNITMAQVPKPRAPTIVAMCTRLGISRFTWHNYRESEEFDLVCEEVEARMRSFKFENAVAGLMNSTLIARDLGLVDKQEVKHSSDGTMMPTRIELVAGKE